jgi:basic membrane protein A
MRRFTTASLALTLAATGAFAGAAAVMAQDGSDLEIGLVTDVGTINDRNFNQFSWEGTQAGAEAVGAGEPQYAISQASADIAPNIQAFVDQGYDIIVTVGFAAGEDTLAAAEANPDTWFIGVDQGAPEGIENYIGIGWREQEPGYLAGIVAASISETGHVGAVGGTAVIPAVVNYIEGYAQGARSVNPDVEVVVAYVSEQPDAAAFADPAGGTTFTQQLLAQDPDIDVMFQVAGLTGNGVLQAACDAGINAIGVDVDQYVSTPETAACTIVSAEKKLSKNVNDAIISIVEGNPSPGINVLGLDTQDVGLSSFHEFEDLITDETRAAIAAAEAGIVDGSIQPCELNEVGLCIQTLP